MKILYFDTETTGRLPWKHEIVQFAAIVEINGKIVDQLEIKIQPTKFSDIDEEAIAVHGFTVEQMKTFTPTRKAWRVIRDLFNHHVNKFDKNDKFYPAGHNVGFDLDMLQSFWRQFDRYGTGSYQNWRALDTRSLANLLVAFGKIDVPDVKLGTLCELYGIEIDAHDALSDVKATRELLYKMREESFGL